MKKILLRDIWFGRFLLFIHRCKLKQHFRTNIKDSNKTKKGTTDKKHTFIIDLKT
jgi:hypothetical protein